MIDIMQFYTYVYYDENWQAYYVGKGQRDRRVFRRDSIEVPSQDRIQSFFFDHEWQAWECEVDLIAFWGRQCDGGCLINKSIGGKGGGTGVKRTEDCKLKMSIAKKGSFTHSSEYKKDMSKKRSGSGNPNYGNKHSPETIKKMSEARKQYWARKKQEAK